MDFNPNRIVRYYDYHEVPGEQEALTFIEFFNIQCLCSSLEMFFKK